MLEKLRFGTIIASTLLSVTWASSSGAQSATGQGLVAVQALYEQALAAMDQNDFATACLRLESVVRMVPEGVGAKLTLAICYEKAGRLASAWSAYMVTESAALQANQAERRHAAHERAEALRPRLAHLTIVVPPSVQALPGIQIAFDGAPIPQEQWGAPLPVDKGRHTLTATATDMTPWEGNTEIETDGASASFEIGELQKAPQKHEKTPQKSEPAHNGILRKSEADNARGPYWTMQRASGAVMGGVGVMGLGAGITLGAFAMAKRDGSNSGGHCHDGNQCDAIGLALRRESLDLGTASTVISGVSNILLASGIVLFTTANRKPKEAHTAVAVGFRGIELRTTW